MCVTMGYDNVEGSGLARGSSYLGRRGVTAVDISGGGMDFGDSNSGVSDAARALVVLGWLGVTMTNGEVVVQQVDMLTRRWGESIGYSKYVTGECDVGYPS